jgi:hypothetical protein
MEAPNSSYYKLKKLAFSGIYIILITKIKIKTISHKILKELSGLITLTLEATQLTKCATIFLLISPH